MAEKAAGFKLLDQIRESVPKRRFLQSWDRESRVLRFGCGDERTAVQVASDGSLEAVDPHRATRLRPSTVKLFQGGAKAENPLGELQKTLAEYLYFPDPRLYTLFSAWITGTYVYSIFSHYGYLFLHSQNPRCGKTRAEEVTSHLAFEATTPRNAPTPPSMRETAVEGGTAIFDRLERWREKGTESFAAAMDLLDAGFRNGGVVSKMVRVEGGDWELEEYPVYAPYMFAAIKKESLTDTALDRSFVIDMVRKSTKLKTRPYDSRCELSCEPIREKLYLCALHHAGAIADLYESEEMQRIIDGLGLHDRAADIWKPLLAVTTVLGDKNVSDQLCALSQEMSPDPDRQEERRQLAVVRALRTLAGEGGALTGVTQQIAEMLLKVTGVECPDLHALLSGWELKEKSMRLPEFDTPRKAWEITDDALAEIERGLLPL
jgi:hypothetical protein